MLEMAMDLATHQDWGHEHWWPIFPLFWIAICAAVLFMVVRCRRKGHRHHGASVENVLAERYARGEISVDEYRERLSVLKERSS